MSADTRRTSRRCWLRDRAGNGLDALLHAVVGELLREIREEGSELSRVDLLLRCSEHHRFERAPLVVVEDAVGVRDQKRSFDKGLEQRGGSRVEARRRRRVLENGCSGVELASRRG